VRPVFVGGGEYASEDSRCHMPRAGTCESARGQSPRGTYATGQTAHAVRACVLCVCVCARPSPHTPSRPLPSPVPACLPPATKKKVWAPTCGQSRAPHLTRAQTRAASTCPCRSRQPVWRPRGTWRGSPGSRPTGSTLWRWGPRGLPSAAC